MQRVFFDLSDKRREEGAEEEGFAGGPILEIRNLKCIALGGVDDGDALVGADPGEPAVIGQMDVSVDKPLGLQLIQEAVEALKTLVGQIIAVVEAPGGGMGQQQIDAAQPLHLGPQSGNPALHFLFGVLEGALPVVPDRAAQAHHPESFPDVDFVVHADAAAGLLLGVDFVVVAVDIEDGHRGKVGQKFQIGAG